MVAGRVCQRGAPSSRPSAGARPRRSAGATLAPVASICLQAGHQNSERNSLERLRGANGAPGELAFNVEVRRRVAAELARRGFAVRQADACANDDPAVTGQDWDLCLAIHYDADVY